MHLARLRAEHPHLFYQEQTWFDDPAEAFMLLRLTEPLSLPDGERRLRRPSGKAPHAIQLADLYVRYPEHPCWEGKVWTCDVDHEGCPVFVGMTGAGRGWQIHRYYEPDETWSELTWE